MTRERPHATDLAASGRRRLFVIVGIGATGLAGALAVLFARSQPAGFTTAALPPVSVATLNLRPDPRAALPPLPAYALPLPRSDRAVQAVYEFAARHPDVLEYIPCFCGCERRGHRSNHDCFVASRDSEGRVAWQSHGMG